MTMINQTKSPSAALSFSIDTKLSGWQSILTQNHSINELSEQLIKLLSHILQAQSAQLYLQSSSQLNQTTAKFKLITHLQSDTPQDIPLLKPEWHKIELIEQQLVLPLSYCQQSIGVIFLQGVTEKNLGLHIDVLAEVSLMGGTKFYSLIEAMELKRFVRVLSEHTLSFSLSNEGKIVEISEALSEQTGYTPEELMGQTPSSIIQPLNSTDGRLLAGQNLLKTKNGHMVWVDTQLIPTENAFGEGNGVLCIQKDITYEKTMEEQAIKDDLTKLYNRRFFNQTFPQELNRAKRAEQLLCFMLIDIDHFKKYNDTYGHHAGDTVLYKVGQTLQNCFKRSGDFVFRTGGEEFAIICNITHEEDAESLANLALMAVLGNKIEHTGNDGVGFVTLSIGLITVNKDNLLEEDELYKMADVALYEAKHQGRNTVRVSGQHDDIELF